MSKERDIQILEHKIADLENKIIKFGERGISEKKTEKLRILKLKYEDELEELMLE
jgi:hypothetical protein